MPPAASTSAAQPPGFRTSRPRRSAAAVATRANLLLANSVPPPPLLGTPTGKGKGKGKARARESYDDQSYDDEDYAPRAGQVQRRGRAAAGRPDGRKKRAREEGNEGGTDGGEGVEAGRKRARKGDGPAAGEARAQEDDDEADEAAMDAALERMDAKRARKKARKDEKRAEQLAQARAREALEDEEAAASQSPLSLSVPLASRARARAATKRVQFAGVAASAGSDSEAGGEWDERALDGAADEGGFAQLGLDDLDLDFDLADPMLIPSAERRRGKRFWRALEHGVYCSALHDVAQGETHLGRALVQWDGLRRVRETEERDEKARVDAARGDEEHGAAPKSSKTARQRLTGMRSHDPRRSVLPMHMGLAEDDADAESTRLRRKFDDEGHELLPLPTSLALARMARWPQHPSSLPDARLSSPLSLEDALLASYERAQRATQGGPSLPEPPTSSARSAYADDGPLASLDDGSLPSSDLGDDAPPQHDPLSDVPDPLEWSSAPPQLAALPSLLSSLLVRLTDCVPKAPLPATDLRSAWARAEEMARDDRRRGLDRDEPKVGWEEVVAVARTGGVKASIVDTLEAQLVALFGPSSRPPVVLPPEGNPAILRLKTRKPTLVRTKPKKRSAVHALKRASASASRRGASAEGARTRERGSTVDEEEEEEEERESGTD
ncbi:hypothetical protein JCM3775_000524 [Rhodotorula graminis]